jgi:hypothetical protein
MQRVERYQLDEDLVLRVRFAGLNVEGSVILLRGGIALECVHYMETRDCEYTETNWIERYRRIYSIDTEGKTDEEIKKENKDAGVFDEGMDVCPLSSGSLVGLTASSPVFKIVSFQDDVLKLKMEYNTPSSRCFIGHTTHVSMQLKFNLIE